MTLSVSEMTSDSFTQKTESRASYRRATFARPQPWWVRVRSAPAPLKA